MSVKISPSPRQQFEDGNGLPYSGAKLFTYVAGSTTKQATYTTSTGSTANSNPIVLDSAGRTPYGVWLTAGLTYKFVLAPSTDTDPPTSPIFTEDNISGVNDTTVSTSQWIASGLTPTYIGATQFSVVGDQTTELHVNRRLKLTVSAGTVYGKISVSAYTTVTTVTVVLDSGSLDSGLSAVEWSILSATNPSIPSQLRATSFSGLVSFSAGADIASAATIDLTAATGNSPRVTGLVATSAVTMTTGQQVLVIADSDWPLTYHATNNRLNTGGDYTCTSGDVILYHKDLAGVVFGSIFSNVGVSSGSVVRVNQVETQTNTATTVTLGTSLFHRLNGTTSITAFNGVAGVTYKILCDGAATITNSASLLILQGSGDITTASSDTFYVYMRTATTCYIYGYSRAIAPITFASSSENIAGTVEGKAVDPLGIREAFNCTGTAPVFACRAWVLFNGSGTVAIRGSGNVSSITDNGTGDYTVNFTTAMPDANYSAVAASGNGASGAGVRQISTNAAADPTTTACRVATGGAGGTAEDHTFISVSFFR